MFRRSTIIALLANAFTISCAFGGEATAFPSSGAAPAPMYRNVSRGLFPGFPDCIPAADLMGYDLETQATAQAPAMPAFTVASPADVVLHLVPRVADPDRLRIRIGIATGDYRVDFVFPIAQLEWKVGTPIKVHCPLRVPPFAASGSGVMTIALQEENPSLLRIQPTNVSDTWVPEAVLYTGEVNVQAAVTDATIAAHKLDAVLGNNTTKLRKAFRLAPHQRVTLHLAEARPFVGLAIASALRGGKQVRQGDAILRIETQSAGNARASYAIQAGEGTALAEHDAFRPGVRPLRQTEIVDVYPYPGHTWKNGGMQAYTYLTRLRVDSALPTDVTFENVSSSFVDVFDVVLLHDAASLTAGEPR